MSTAAIIGQRRAAWRRLIGEARKVAERAEASQGREELEIADFSHLVTRDGRLPFDVDGQLATQVSMAFLLTAKAMLNAGYAARRAIVAPMLLAAAKAADELLTEQGHREAQVSRRQTGEG